MSYKELVFPNGDEYKGEWQDGQGPTGRGVMTYKSGTVYDGEWNDWKYHGYGVYTMKSGYRYEGEWEKDVKHGHGIEISENGDRYEGDWADDKKQGKGSILYANGDRFEGEWKYYPYNGQILKHFKDGSYYEGELVGYYISSNGTLYYPDGAFYNGGFKDDKPHGDGVYTYQSGERFEGKWEGGVRNGKGTFVFSDGVSEQAEYTDGKIVNAGERSLALLGMRKEQLLYCGAPVMTVTEKYSYFGSSGVTTYRFSIRVGKIPYSEMVVDCGKGRTDGCFEITSLTEDSVSFVVEGKYLESGVDEIHTLSLNGEEKSFEHSKDYRVTVEGDEFDCVSERKLTVSAKQ